jgi:hypothetical protein
MVKRDITMATQVIKSVVKCHELFVISSSIVAMTAIIGRNVACLSRGICIPPHHIPCNLVEETENLSSNVLPAGLLVVHDASRGGEDNVTELTRGQQLDDPLLHVAELDVVAGRDDTGLVDAAVELDDDLAVAVVVDLLELANVAW